MEPLEPRQGQRLLTRRDRRLLRDGTLPADSSSAGLGAAAHLLSARPVGFWLADSEAWFPTMGLVGYQQLGRGRRKTMAHAVFLIRSLFTQSAPTPAPSTGPWKRLESPACWPPSEARGTEMGSGHAASPAPQLIGREEKPSCPPRSSRVTQGPRRRGWPGTHPSLKAASDCASLLGLPGHLARPHTPEDRLSPQCPDLLTAFPKQAPCSEAGGSSPRLQCGDKS